MTTAITVTLRRQVTNRAGNCCEYCLLSQSDSFFRFHVDHVISEKHDGPTESDNLCLSCPDCNTFKGSDIGSLDRQTNAYTGLFNPRVQQWVNHFRLVGPVIESTTPEGRVTVFLLRLNMANRLLQRHALLRMNRYPCNPSSPT